jgi:outer membrane immunogenic protein
MGTALRTIFSATASMLVLGLGSISVRAADLPPPAASPPLYVPASFTWTGFYIGGNVGGAWANTTLTDNRTGVSLSGHLGGWLGGGQVGFNYQNGPILVGVEALFDGTSLSSTTSPVPVMPFGVLQASANTQWVTTAAARFGVVVDYAQRWLIYGKAGGGWVGNSATVTNLTTGLSANATNSNAGWLLGAGIEYAFAHNWTLKLEYDYLALQNWTAASPLIADTLNVRRQLNMLMIGVNYKFDWGGPVVARY